MMHEREAILRGLRELLELERAAGIEAIPRGGLAAARVVVETPAPVAEAAPAAPVAAPPQPPPGPAPVAMPAPTGLAAGDLAALAHAIGACRACPLAATRTCAVPGEGSAEARLVFVLDAPAHADDQAGRPALDPAGELLGRMIQAMGLSRGEVYITHLVKCRPPAGRAAAASELDACRGFLVAQLAALTPQVVVPLGPGPTRALLGADPPFSLARGKRFERDGRAIMPSFDPGFLMRNADLKKSAWEDLKAVVTALGRTLPKR